MRNMLKIDQAKGVGVWMVASGRKESLPTPMEKVCDIMFVL
jgi:hypothetical protein